MSVLVFCCSGLINSHLLSVSLMEVHQVTGKVWDVDMSVVVFAQCTTIFESLMSQ